MDSIDMRNKANALVDDLSNFLNRRNEMSQKRRHAERILSETEELRFGRMRHLEELKRSVAALSAGSKELSNMRGHLSSEIGKIQDDMQSLSSDFDGMLVHPSDQLESFEEAIDLVCKRQTNFYAMEDEEVFDEEVKNQKFALKSETMKVANLRSKLQERAAELAKLGLDRELDGAPCATSTTLLCDADKLAYLYTVAYSRKQMLG